MSQPKYQPRWQLPAPEEVAIDTLYAFSLSPQCGPASNLLGGFQLRSFKNYQVELWAKLDKLKYCQVNAVHELSRLARWHMHGYIMIDKIIEFYLFDLPILKDIGTFEIDTIADEVKWETYVYKQMTLLKPFCDANRMEYQYK